MASGGEEMNTNWPMTPLREILAQRQEQTAEDSLLKNEIRIIEKIGFDDGKIHLRSDCQTKTGMILIRPGDLVVSGINAAKGAIALYGEDNKPSIAATIHYCSYIPDKSKIDVQYLWRLLRSNTFRVLLQEYVPGGIKTELKAKRLLPIPIPLPPLDEQRRIVSRIEELAARIEEARELRRRAVEEADAFLKSSLKDLFTFADIDAQPLRQIAILRGGGTPSKSNPYHWEGDIPWISPKDMKYREITDSLDHISEAATHESPAKLLDPGVVLIVVRGMILAKMVPIAVLKVPGTINQDMKALVPCKDLMPEYLCGALWAFNRGLLELVEKSTHDTRKLETSKLLDFKIPVPSLDQQKDVLIRLNDLQSKLDALRRHQADTAAELDALLPAVLERAFRGERP